MRIFAAILLILMTLSNSSFRVNGTQESPADFRKVENVAFAGGEYLKYKLHYGWLTAGYVELQIKDKPTVVSGRSCYHVVGKGYTSSGFNMFYDVDDVYQTYVDTESLIPWRFIRDVDEDGFIIKRDISFDHVNRTATCKYDKTKTKFDMPSGVQDMMSGFYYARCIINFDELKVGDYYMIPIFMDYQIYPMKITYTGKEIVKTEHGKMRCLRFKPGVQKGRIFKDEQDVTLYVSDDINKFPVQVKAEILVGSVKITLDEYRGLKNPIGCIVD